VTEAIERLAARFSLVLVTKGDLWNQESKLARSGLADRFDAVHIVGEKDRGTYARILREHRVPPEQFLMAGNSERSDILPVLELGGYGVHVPYSVTWAHELLPESAERAHPRRRDLPTLAELPDLLGLLSVTAGAEPPPAPCRPLRSDS
jgi:putative hydrolase of the HAD superfamily